MALHSMTAFASLPGTHAAFDWTWEVRGVNSKGLDLRIRVPDWITGLEPAVRAAFTKKLGRGNVQIGLRINRSESEDALGLDLQQLDRVLGAIQLIEERASAQGVALRPATAADILAHRGVAEGQGAESGAPEGLGAALTDQLPALIDAFETMRAAEGAGLTEVLTGQIDTIERLTTEARDLLPKRAAAQRTHMAQALGRVTENTDDLDANRIAQELALIAIKSDVAEELDRLTVHVASARALLGASGPVGRKLDFLAQEFNREANTLCSKAAQSDLTQIGLDLKVAIDQMREQIQNVE